MAEFVVRSEDLIPPSDYPAIADSLPKCQTYLDGESSFLVKTQHRAFGKMIREESLGKKVGDLLFDKKVLAQEINILTSTAEQETDPYLKRKVLSDLKLTEAKLELIELELESKKSVSAKDVFHANADATILDVKYRAYRQAIIDYLNNYVVPGNIGEGSVTFEGVEYVAELATQN
ncbi:hypothetical protein FUAX_26050 [Fulvitalea axinellae]|uniref:Uncharacterized protein n=1 Tax=Fulvitalea axinellae TaxID=1182444 RepID=A0AAU9CQ31_9BACT|nr:hypothetical protein FUAX_26050 [Fulvitalea axinellae]